MSTPRRRIAVISVHSCPLASLGGKQTGGMSVYVKEMAQEMGRRGLQVDIFTRCHDASLPQVEEWAAGARVIHLPAGEPKEMAPETLYGHLPPFLGHILRFGEKNDLKYDLIQSHYWLSGWVAARLRDLWGIPLVAMFHTLGEVKNWARPEEQESPLRIETERDVLASADAVIASSPDEKAQMLRLYDAMAGTIEVIPGGVDLERFHPMDQAEARRELGLDDSRLILFVGRLDPFKGIELLLEATAQIKKKEGLRLLIVGGDAESQGEVHRWGGRAWELGIDSIVTFVGAVPQDRLPFYYNAADVCVVPSYHESYGLVAVEAMACGTPVIASRVGGLMSTVKDSETGYLIPWHRSEAFAERMELVLGNEALAQGLGRRARLAVAGLGWPAIADRVLALYGRLIAIPSSQRDSLSCEALACGRRR